MGVLNEWLTEEESLWLQSRIQLRALSYYSGWLPYFSAYYTGRLYWQLRNGDNLPLLRETFARKEFDDAGRRMMNKLIAGKDSFTPRCRGATCPITLNARTRFRR